MIANNLGTLFAVVTAVMLALAVGLLVRRAFHLSGFSETSRIPVGEVQAVANRGDSAFLRVQRVRNSLAAGDQVGLEVWIPAAADNSRTAITLSATEARSLVELLQAATPGQNAAANQSSTPKALRGSA